MPSGLKEPYRECPPSPPCIAHRATNVADLRHHRPHTRKFSQPLALEMGDRGQRNRKQRTEETRKWLRRDASDSPRPAQEGERLAPRNQRLSPRGRDAPAPYGHPNPLQPTPYSLRPTAVNAAKETTKNMKNWTDPILPRPSSPGYQLSRHFLLIRFRLLG